MGRSSRRKREKRETRAFESPPTSTRVAAPSVDARATVAVPLIADCVRRLCDLAGTMIRDIRLPDDDQFPFMACCFLEKQIAHARGALLLDDHPDSFLIARSMLEGVWQLTWAAQSRAERAELWSRYTYIHDWRILHERNVHTARIDNALRAEINAQVKRYGPLYRLGKARPVARPDGTLFTDPYRNNWHGKSVLALAQAAGDEDEYHRGYDLCSQRHHWDPADAARAVVRDATTIRYVGASPLAQASALVLVFSYLFRMAEVVNTSLTRNMGEQLESIGEQYMATAGAAGYEISRGVT